MKLRVYSIFDKACGAYTRPFFVQADEAAIRAFKDDALRPDSVVGKHPEDYSLFHVGHWDDNEGSLKACEPVCIGRAHELLSRGTEFTDDGEDRLRVNGGVVEEKVDAA